MNYRAVVTSDRTEDMVLDTFEAACDAALMLSEEFGWVDVRPNYCSSPISCSYYNGYAA